MVEYIRDIDLCKYHTFFLEYYKDSSALCHHIVRPCEATYEEYTDVSRNRIITLEGGVLAFTYDTPLAEIIMECSLHGIYPDFIDIKTTGSRWENDKIVQVIDTHKEDITKHLEKYEAPVHYVVKSRSKRKNDTLKYLVVNRFSQNSKVNFMSGKYDDKAVVAGFREQKDAVEFCKKMNKEQ